MDIVWSEYISHINIFLIFTAWGRRSQVQMGLGKWGRPCDCVVCSCGWRAVAPRRSGEIWQQSWSDSWWPVQGARRLPWFIRSSQPWNPTPVPWSRSETVGRSSGPTARDGWLHRWPKSGWYPLTSDSSGNHKGGTSHPPGPCGAALPVRITASRCLWCSSLSQWGHLWGTRCVLHLPVPSSFPRVTLRAGLQSLCFLTLFKQWPLRQHWKHLQMWMSSSCVRPSLPVHVLQS